MAKQMLEIRNPATAELIDRLAQDDAASASIASCVSARASSANSTRWPPP
jgi:uncharacterized alpha-E superfamily protein